MARVTDMGGRGTLTLPFRGLEMTMRSLQEVGGGYGPVDYMPRSQTVEVTFDLEAVVLENVVVKTGVGETIVLKRLVLEGLRQVRGELLPVYEDGQAKIFDRTVPTEGVTLEKTNGQWRAQPRPLQRLPEPEVVRRDKSKKKAKGKVKVNPYAEIERKLLLDD